MGNTKNKPKNTNIVVGRHTYGHENIHIRSYKQVKPVIVGSFCSIAEGLVIFTGGQHNQKNITTYPFSAFPKQFPKNSKAWWVDKVSKGGVTIGSDIWIGASVTIMSGVTIHDGAIIGTHSVVASDIPPYAIAVGNPCRVIKNRFDDITIKKLLEIKWWNWPIEKILEHAALLESENMDEFFKVADNLK